MNSEESPSLHMLRQVSRYGCKEGGRPEKGCVDAARGRILSDAAMRYLPHFSRG